MRAAARAQTINLTLLSLKILSRGPTTPPIIKAFASRSTWRRRLFCLLTKLNHLCIGTGQDHIFIL